MAERTTDPEEGVHEVAHATPASVYHWVPLESSVNGLTLFVLALSPMLLVTTTNQLSGSTPLLLLPLEE